MIPIGFCGCWELDCRNGCITRFASDRLKCWLMLVENFQLYEKLNMDIFVRVKSENNRIGFCSIFGERYMPLLKNIMRISALLCPHFGCSDSRSSPVRDCPAGRHMYLGCGYFPGANTMELQAALSPLVSGAAHHLFLR